jgi:hypothetical protein
MTKDFEQQGEVRQEPVAWLYEGRGLFYTVEQNAKDDAERHSELAGVRLVPLYAALQCSRPQQALEEGNSEASKVEGDERTAPSELPWDQKPLAERARLLADELEETSGRYTEQGRKDDGLLAQAAFVLRALLASPEYVYAKSLAESLWRKHFRERAPDWKPLPDLLGVLTQIDNMVAELVASSPAAGGAPLEWEDADDQWSEQIDAAHPMKTGAHRQYATALEMVGHRRSKGELVALVCWLLQRAVIS